jgi:hypothetical protein
MATLSDLVTEELTNRNWKKQQIGMASFTSTSNLFRLIDTPWAAWRCAHRIRLRNRRPRLKYRQENMLMPLFKIDLISMHRLCAETDNYWRLIFNFKSPKSVSIKENLSLPRVRKSQA